MASDLRTALRPVRDLLYNTLNPQEMFEKVPEVSEDEKKSLDTQKGFSYFTSFDELFRWTPESCREVQKSEAPLLKRPDVLITEKRTSKLTLIHDYGSGYHEYESRIPTNIDEPEYCCNYLRFVDNFVYFTHFLVSVPPPTWINLLHKNGVKALGTFLIEPQTLNLEQMLARQFEKGPEGDVEYFLIVRKLSQLAKIIGFDGWLINIEKAFPPEIYNLELILSFLRQLRAETPQGMIIFYDSLTAVNTKSPQNALTPLNLPFLQAAGNILLNYRWNPSLISSSLALAQQHGLNSESLIFGIDLWAQNRPRNYWHPRVTWPSSSGGGTNTGHAVGKLAEMGVSAGLFAPAWSHQHFVSKGDREAAERAVWLGEELGKEVRCECRPGWFDPADPHRTAEYRGNGIVRAARELPAGGEKYFYTNFHQGFVKKVEAEEHYVSMLGEQTAFPTPQDRFSWELDPYSNSLFLLTHRGVVEKYIKLYNLGIMIDDVSVLRVRYRTLMMSHTTAHLILTFADNGTRVFYLKDGYGREKKLKVSIGSDEGIRNARLIEIGVRLKKLPRESDADQFRALELIEIGIGSFPAE